MPPSLSPVRALDGITPHLVLLEAVYLLALSAAAASSGGQPCPAAQAGAPGAEVALSEFASWASSTLLALALAVVHPLLALGAAASAAAHSACVPFSLGAAGPAALGRLAGSQITLLAASMGLAERERQLSPGRGPGGLAERWHSTVKFLRGAIPTVLAASLIPAALEALGV